MEEKFKQIVKAYPFGNYEYERGPHPINLKFTNDICDKCKNKITHEQKIEERMEDVEKPFVKPRIYKIFINRFICYNCYKCTLCNVKGSLGGDEYSDKLDSQYPIHQDPYCKKCALIQDPSNSEQTYTLKHDSWIPVYKCKNCETSFAEYITNIDDPHFKEQICNKCYATVRPPKTKGLYVLRESHCANSYKEGSKYRWVNANTCSICLNLYDVYQDKLNRSKYGYQYVDEDKLICSSCMLITDPSNEQFTYEKDTNKDKWEIIQRKCCIEMCKTKVNFSPYNIKLGFDRDSYIHNNDINRAYLNTLVFCSTKCYNLLYGSVIDKINVYILEKWESVDNLTTYNKISLKNIAEIVHNLGKENTKLSIQTLKKRDYIKNALIKSKNKQKEQYVDKEKLYIYLYENMAEKLLSYIIEDKEAKRIYYKENIYIST